MKIAILADDGDGFVKPMAKGLNRMFNKINIKSDILYKAHKNLYFHKISLKNSFKANVLNLLRNFRTFLFLPKLIKYDILVLVASIPGTFLPENTPLIELIRKYFPRKVIILYDVLYLPTTTTNDGTLWHKRLKEGILDNRVQTLNNFGMERFDYYFISSVITEYPLPKIEHPLSIIGINYEQTSLYVEPKKRFIALVDFERNNTNPEERKIQIQALKDTNTEYIELKEHLSSESIREIYRKCSLYFLAHRESFGLPICELQLCGAYVFTPYKYWVPAHFSKEDLFSKKQGKLSRNFVVYNNNLEVLKKKINLIKKEYNAQKVYDTFLQDYPQFYYGDIKELEKFITLYKKGHVTGQSHENYIHLNKHIDYKNKIDITKYYNE